MEMTEEILVLEPHSLVFIYKKVSSNERMRSSPKGPVEKVPSSLLPSLKSHCGVEVLRLIRFKLGRLESGAFSAVPI